MPAPQGRACPAKPASPAPHPWDNAPPASTLQGAAPMSRILRPVDPSTASRTRQPVDSVVTEPCDHPDFSVTEPCDGHDDYLTVSYSRRMGILRQTRPPGPGKRRGLPAESLKKMRNIIVLAPRRPGPPRSHSPKSAKPTPPKTRQRIFLRNLKRSADGGEGGCLAET